MSAIVCGKRSNFFEDLQSSPSPSPPPVSKRIRRSSSSPVRFSPPRSAAVATGNSFYSAPSFPGSLSNSPALDHLISLFPDMDKQVLGQVLEGSDDLDSAIKILNELRLSSVENLSYATSKGAEAEQSNNGTATRNGETASTQDPSPVENLSINSAEWVEFFVSEMMSSSNIDDAKFRATRALDILEKSICAHVNAEAAQTLQQENTILKSQLEALLQENNILKKAVSIQHERQKEFEDRNQELHQLKQLVSQYQEQLRTLEVNNYALTMHLKQAQENNSMPGRFHPDVF